MIRVFKHDQGRKTESLKRLLLQYIQKTTLLLSKTFLLIIWLNMPVRQYLQIMDSFNTIQF